MSSLPAALLSGLPTSPLPPASLARRTEGVAHAPKRNHGLDKAGMKVPYVSGGE